MRTGMLYQIRRGWLVVPLALILLAAVAWLWPSPNPDAQVATAWGLPGVWQQDCAAPLGADNPQYKYSIEQDKLLLRRDFGGGASDTSEMSNVATTPTGEIYYTVHFTQLGHDRRGRASRQNMLTKSPDGRIRTIANKHAGSGEPSVIGGIRTEDGKPTPWMTRCRPE